jgi:hypothetical protein
MLIMVGNRDDGSMELTYLGSVVRFVEVKLASTPLQYLQGASISPSASRRAARAWTPGRLRRALGPRTILHRRRETARS